MSYHLGLLPTSFALPMFPTRSTTPTTAATDTSGGKAGDALTVQGLLAQLGLYAGLLSGEFDGNTRKALDTFRAAVGLPIVTGITAQDLAALKTAVYKAAASPVPPAATDATAALSPEQMAALRTASVTMTSEGLPAWVLPAGAVVGGLLLWRLLR